MSALRYKSKIDVPAVVLPNSVELTSPAAKRVAVSGIWDTTATENHTRDNDLVNFGNLVNFTITLADDAAIEGSTVEQS